MARLRSGAVVWIVAISGASPHAPSHQQQADSPATPPAGVVLHASSPVTPSAFAVPAVPPQSPRIAIDFPNTVLGPGIKLPAGG